MTRHEHGKTRLVKFICKKNEEFCLGGNEETFWVVNNWVSWNKKSANIIYRTKSQKVSVI